MVLQTLMVLPHHFLVPLVPVSLLALLLLLMQMLVLLVVLASGRQRVVFVLRWLQVWLPPSLEPLLCNAESGQIVQQAPELVSAVLPVKTLLLEDAVLIAMVDTCQKLEQDVSSVMQENILRTGLRSLVQLVQIYFITVLLGPPLVQMCQQGKNQQTALQLRIALRAWTV